MAAIISLMFPAASQHITSVALVLVFALFAIAVIAMVGLSFRQGVFLVEMNLAVAFATGLWPALCVWLATLFGGLENGNPTLAADMLESGALASVAVAVVALGGAVIGRMIGNDGP